MWTKPNAAIWLHNIEVRTTSFHENLVFCLEWSSIVSNKGKPWRPGEEDVLKKRVLLGASLGAISKELGRTERSIRARIATLGLPLRTFGTKHNGIRKYG